MNIDENNPSADENMEIAPENFIVNDDVLDSNSFGGAAKVFQCDLCQQFFTNKIKMTIHWIINHSYKICQMCPNLAFKYDSDKIQHEQQHLPFGCSGCSHEFNTIQEDIISDHYKRCHGSYLCTLCSSVINPISMYPEHLTKKHNVAEGNAQSLPEALVELPPPDKKGKQWFYCKLCDKKREISILVGHFLFHHLFSIQAFLKMIEGFSDIVINGLVVNENIEIAMDDENSRHSGENDENICQVCDVQFEDDDSKVHRVFCSGFVICKQKECDQLFKTDNELSTHVKKEHPVTNCKFGCSDIKLKTTEVDKHLEKLHDIIECYMCNIVNSSSNFKNHLKDKHSVKLASYEKAVSKKGSLSKLYRVELTRSRIKAKKKKVLCNLCDEDITDEIRQFSFVNHYKTRHTMTIGGIIRNLNKNPIIDIILDEKEEKTKEKDFIKNFKLEIDGKSLQEMVEIDFDTSKVSCIGNDDHLAKTSKKKNKCEFCKTSFDAACKLYSHLNKTHGFQLSNVKDYCSTCKVYIEKPNENTDEEEDVKDFNLSIVCPLDQSYHVTKNNYKDHMLYDHSNSNFSLDKIIYKCLECNFTYNELEDIREHFKSTHPSIQMNYCRLCRVKFDDLSDSGLHFDQNHSKELKKIFACQLCKKAFKEEKVAKRHYEHQHSTRKDESPADVKKGTKRGFKCRVCSEFFTSKQDRSVHTTVVHPEDKTFKCTQCPMLFKSKGTRSTHFMSVHKNVQYKCEHCQKLFTRRDSYKEHLMIHSSFRHSCGFCDKAFVQRSNLVRHERIHLGIHPYTCSFCDKTFSDKGACRSHENVHTRADYVACDICGSSYAKKQKLKYHMRKHSMQNLLKCNQCGKICTESYSFKKHMESHADELLFECQHCFKRFKSKRRLNEHVNKAHNFDPSLPYIETKIVCTICNFVAPTSIAIEEHLKTFHLISEADIGDWQNFVKNVEFEMGEGV